MSNTLLIGQESAGGSTKLRQKCLGGLDVFAQSVANIGPSGAPLIAVPVIAASAGSGTWLAYLIAAIGTLFIASNINHFARRTSGTGSLNDYITMSLGPNAGVVAGWCLAIAYIGCGASCVTPFANLLNTLVAPLGFTVPPLLSIVIATLIAWFLTWKDVRISAKVMLFLEISTLIIGSLLAGIILYKIGWNIDLTQFSSSKLSASGVMLGTVLAFMCMTGFESATMVGDEAKNPLKTIPRAVALSVVIAGVYYVVQGYTMVSAFRFVHGTTLITSSTPVADVAGHFGVSVLAVLLTLGAMVSALAVVVASINAGARSLYLMSENGILHESVSNAHAANKTPHIAINIVTLITFIVPTVLVLTNNGLLAIWGYVGSVCTFGFLVVYFLIVVAGPVYLHQQKLLKPYHIVVSILGCISVLVPFVGSIYPVPPFPSNILIYIFAVLLAVGLARYAWQCKHQANFVANINEHVAQTYNRFAKEREANAREVGGEV